jgi:hypothetical protein
MKSYDGPLRTTKGSFEDLFIKADGSSGEQATQPFANGFA